MLDQLPRHPWHVRWLPCEDVGVSPEEVDERVFLFGVETRPDGSSLAAVACPEVNCFDQNLLSYQCLNLSTSMGGTRSKAEGGDRHDLEPKGTREDTRHKIYTGSGSRSSYPTSCLE
jgi:hypothetical protein